MSMRWRAKLAGVGLLMLATSSPTLAASGNDVAADCKRLTTLRIPDLRIADATLIVPSPTFEVSGARRSSGMVGRVNVPFCRVEGVVEEEIEFEAWLPLSGAWNLRMFGSGNGGHAGFMRYDGVAMGVKRGFASITTNTGHRQGQENWAIDEPQRLENYAHRGQHLVAVNAKKIIAAFYGSTPEFSYFLGCSGGGMQAMNEVQRYPADYDGIIAGASGQSIAGIAGRWVTSALFATRNPAYSPTVDDWRRIQAYQIDECDKADGVVDGVIFEPMQCRARIASTPGLRAVKLAIAEQLAGAIKDHDGNVVFPAFTPGIAFEPRSDPGSPGKTFSLWYYNDPNWDFDNFDAGFHVPLVEAAIPGLSFTNPNLTAFQRRGGKLIAAQGWTDPIVPAQSIIDYRVSVARFMGEKVTDSFFRLFVAPGVDHCGGGNGADRFTMSPGSESPIVDADHDLLEALVRWVEKDEAPDRVIASKVVDGEVVMTRPVCAFPKVTRYRSHGDTNDAASFSCVDP